MKIIYCDKCGVELDPAVNLAKTQLQLAATPIAPFEYNMRITRYGEPSDLCGPCWLTLADVALTAMKSRALAANEKTA